MRSTRASTSKKSTQVASKTKNIPVPEPIPKTRGTKRKAPSKEVQPKKVVKYEPISIVYDLTDPIIEHLRNSSIQEDGSIKNNATICDSEILDQISLEGLSGTTLSRLLLILDAIHGKLNSQNDSKCQGYIWSIILNNLRYHADCRKLTAYYVNPNRIETDCANESQNNDQNEPAVDKTAKKVFIDKKISLPPQTYQKSRWIGTSVAPVQFGLTMGHCNNYLDRIDITEELIEYAEKNESMSCLHHMNTKYGIDNVFIVASQNLRNESIYPRWADPNVSIKLREYCTLELIGKFRTLGTVFPNDKTLGRYRLMLLAKNFIAQFQKTMCSPIEILLKRFEQCRPMEETILFTGNNNSSNLNAIKSRVCDVSDDEDDGGEGNNDRCRARSCLDPGGLKPDRSVFNMIYEKIAESVKGVTKLEIRREMHMPKFHLRNHLKNLISIKMICSKENTDTTTNEDNKFRLYRIAHKIPRQKLNNSSMRDGHLKRRKNGDPSRPTTGIMASWDDADLRAKRIIGPKRSSFSQYEDFLLIVSRITSLLIDPNLRLTWCVHKRLVRDLLHKELIESHDKTSDACLRRIKYLKRLPDNIMLINELTAELRDKPEVTRLLKANKPDGCDRRMERLFKQILKIVRNQMPNLIGLPGANNSSSSSSHNYLNDTDYMACMSSSNETTANLGIDGRVISLTAANGAPMRLLARSSNIKLENKQSNMEYNEASSTTFANLYPNQLDKSVNSLTSFQNSNSPGYLSACIAGSSSARLADDPTMSIRSHADLLQNFDLIDCHSLASLTRSTALYDKPKNVVDIKFNNACLVTMAQTLANSFIVTNNIIEQQQQQQQQQRLYQTKLLNQSLLDKFYSAYQDKMISSVLSKLNKQSLLTRKCPATDQASLYKPRSKTTLKLNQNVRFLLNRYQSSSLMQLAQLQASKYKLDLEESNEMTSIASLTSFASATFFSHLNLDLRIPKKIVDMDLSQQNQQQQHGRPSEKAPNDMRDGLIVVQPCKVRFYSEFEITFIDKPMEDFLNGQSRFTSLTKTARHAAKAHAKTICDPNPNSSQATTTTTDSKLTSIEASKQLNKQPLTSATATATTTTSATTTSSLDSLQLQSPSMTQQQQQLASQSNVAWAVKGYRPSAASLASISATFLAANSNQKQTQANSTNSDDDVVFAKPVAGIVSQSGRSDMDDDDDDLQQKERSCHIELEPIEFSARLWKTIDGQVQTTILIKLIESLLSWIIVYPGIESQQLQKEFNHLLPEEHLEELFELMLNLELITCEQVKQRVNHIRLFGYKTMHAADDDDDDDAIDKHQWKLIRTYEPTPKCYIRFGQLLKYQKANLRL